MPAKEKTHESRDQIFYKNRKHQKARRCDSRRTRHSGKRSLRAASRKDRYSFPLQLDVLGRRGLVFGASVTVTTENAEEVSSNRSLGELERLGCKAVIFVEYVPVTDESMELAPGDREREIFDKAIERLRAGNSEMMYASFPGDEKSSGGCFAAGRGFFHINSHGGAEPCPFSPYSDINVKDTSLREAISSPLFTALRDGDILLDDHEGGCVLYQKRAIVKSLAAQH